MRPCRWCLSGFLSLFHAELSDGLWTTVEQFIKFACVGCSNAIILLVVYYIAIFILGESAYLLGQTLGYTAGILNSYFWNIASSMMVIPMAFAYIMSSLVI